ncbi:MAG TPA: quinone oxidoreductase [Hyphomonadaceae bacterium]|nr:quinone oxidoreductase [Hyphomonadaceae bacterium]HPN05389.1 quinone oxidoreductase [Hyphomonadaceae bacterium]
MSTADVIRIHSHGGPEEMKFEKVELAAPAAGEVRLRQTAIGLNFIDVYTRTGLYPGPTPAVLGVEAAGVVEALGEGVANLKVGDRVVYNGLAGSYASHRNAPADRLITVPDFVKDEDAAAVFLKGLTAWMLIFEIRRLNPGETIVVWAAAGGVGSILVPWANAMGARVIGVVSTPEKATLAKEYGCWETILANEDVPARVKELNDGKGVPVVYDSVGKTSAEPSLKSLAPRGWFITYGNASGPADPIPPGRLNQGGSLIMTRPGLFHFTHKRSDLERGAAAVWGAMRAGAIRADVRQRFALKDAAEAHRALEGRKTSGATILLP